MQLPIDRDSGVPVGTQLAWRLRSAIERGELRPGDRLPSLRDAATAAGVNVNTVRAAYAKLESAGVVTTEQGRGTFVALTDGGESTRRRGLRDDIARLEAELVRLPLLPQPADRAAQRGPVNAQLLSVEELETIRNVLAERVRELDSARTAIVERLRDERRSRPEASPSPTPARRSSSSLAGAHIRWTGA